MKNAFLATLVFAMVASAAMAQHHGGGPGQMPGRAPGGMGDDRGMGPLLVGSDGTAFVFTTTVDTTANTASTKITAIRPTGAIAWTATIANNRGHFELSGTNLITVSEATATDGTVSTTLTAYSTSSGAQTWTRTLSGRVGQLTPFSGGTYAIVVVPASTSGGTATRSLVGIGNDGTVLFTTPLI